MQNLFSRFSISDSCYMISCLLTWMAYSYKIWSTHGWNIACREQLFLLRVTQLNRRLFNVKQKQIRMLNVFLSFPKGFPALLFPGLGKAVN